MIRTSVFHNAAAHLRKIILTFKHCGRMATSFVIFFFLQFSSLWTPQTSLLQPKVIWMKFMYNEIAQRKTLHNYRLHYNFMQKKASYNLSVNDKEGHEIDQWALNCSWAFDIPAQEYISVFLDRSKESCMQLYAINNKWQYKKDPH